VTWSEISLSQTSPFLQPTGAPRCFLGNPDATIPVAKTLTENALCEAGKGSSRGEGL